MTQKKCTRIVIIIMLLSLYFETFTYITQQWISMTYSAALLEFGCYISDYRVLLRYNFALFTSATPSFSRCICKYCRWAGPFPSCTLGQLCNGVQNVPFRFDFPKKLRWWVMGQNSPDSTSVLFGNADIWVTWFHVIYKEAAAVSQTLVVYDEAVRRMLK